MKSDETTTGSARDSDKRKKWKNGCSKTSGREIVLNDKQTSDVTELNLFDTRRYVYPVDKTNITNITRSYVRNVRDDDSIKFERFYWKNGIFKPKDFTNEQRRPRFKWRRARRDTRGTIEYLFRYARPFIVVVVATVVLLNNLTRTRNYSWQPATFF